MSDFIEQASESIKQAAEKRSALCIKGGGSKFFYGREIDGTLLETGSHRGIVEYEPSELVLTARAGTPLKEIEDRLAEHGQILPFEPPHFGEGATIGGAFATGLSGPRRPHAGAARDLLLGCRIINGFGEHLAFGGRVMKNVAGYDVSRLMVGALGTLGLITEVSVKVLPRPVAETTLAFECTLSEAVDTMNRWAAKPLPISATCHDGRRLFVRLSGTEAGVHSASQGLGGESSSAPELWIQVREQRHPFFGSASSLWRVSVPPASPPLRLDGATFVEWNGGLRWLASDAPARTVRDAAAAAGGHAIWFRGHDGKDVFHPMDGSRLALHRNLKRAFDPAGILNPGRMYAGI